MVGFVPLVTPLFVPATRPERFAKAAASGADAIIIDLEDAVPPQEKDTARKAIADLSENFPVPTFVRINAPETEWYSADVDAMKSAEIAGVMLPKTQSSEELENLSNALGAEKPIIGLIETARGVASLADICAASALSQIAFGSIDFSIDVGCEENRDSLLLARSALVVNSRANDLPAPIDGVTTDLSDADKIRGDSAYAASLGFGGKLLIHPAQIAPARRAFEPSERDVEWAKRVLAADREAGGGAAKVDGQMIDRPVVLRAKSIIQRSAQ